MNRLRFPSLLNPHKWGFEYTNESMTFWDEAYRNGPVVSCSMGYYETLGDAGVQHTPIRACRTEQFTDYLISLSQYLLDHPDEEMELHTLRVCETTDDAWLFFAGIKYKEDKRQWFTTQDGYKISTAPSKQHDKRWIEVPSYANGTVESAYRLHRESLGAGVRELFTEYSVQASARKALFYNTLHGDWDKATNWTEQIDGDHSAAYFALVCVVESRRLADVAKRQLSCAVHNSRNQVEAVA